MGEGLIMTTLLLQVAIELRSRRVRLGTDGRQVFAELPNGELLTVSGERLVYDRRSIAFENCLVRINTPKGRSLYEGKEVDQQTHLGFDLASTQQAPVTAANRGVVVHAAYLGIYGNCIVVDHGEIAHDGHRVATLYGHLSSMSVRAGATVSRGQQIGGAGTTGSSTGVHLHFEVRIDGEPVNPMPYLT